MHVFLSVCREVYMAAIKVTPQVTGASVSVVPPTGERVCERVCVAGQKCKITVEIGYQRDEGNPRQLADSRI